MHRARVGRVALAFEGNGLKMLNYRNLLVAGCFLALAGCDNAAKPTTPDTATNAGPASSVSLPTYETAGVITSLEGQILTLDHEGASAAGLNAGRGQFIVYGDVVAEAPITPGSRVKVRFQKTAQGFEVSSLEPRA